MFLIEQTQTLLMNNFPSETADFLDQNMLRECVYSTKTSDGNQAGQLEGCWIGSASCLPQPGWQQRRQAGCPPPPLPGQLGPLLLGSGRSCTVIVSSMETINIWRSKTKYFKLPKNYYSSRVSRKKL